MCEGAMVGVIRMELARNHVQCSPVSHAQPILTTPGTSLLITDP